VLGARKQGENRSGVDAARRRTDETDEYGLERRLVDVCGRRPPAGRARDQVLSEKPAGGACLRDGEVIDGGRWMHVFSCESCARCLFSSAPEWRKINYPAKLTE
jgi:hypothetical protein